MISEKQLDGVDIFIAKVLRVFPESEIVIKTISRFEQENVCATVTVRRWKQQYNVATSFSEAELEFSDPRTIWDITAKHIINNISEAVGKPEELS